MVYFLKSRTRESFESGALIFKQGAVGDFFYIIRSGEVDITKNTGGGKEERLVTLGSGQSFGEKALLKEDTRSANARCKTDAKCYTLDRKGTTSFSTVISNRRIFYHAHSFVFKLEPDLRGDQQARF